ncbi:dTDP-4-dehydrorhamnose reductase [bacterium]|nr:dTDP-4-dehydrorhamnose reductase [bacterium]
MKVLVTGAAGMLGHDLLPKLAARGLTAVGVDLDRADISVPESVRALLADEKPQVVIHAAAWTDVERAESEPEAARRVNVDGARNVAAACAALGARMILIGTDFVFDGAKAAPYVESDQTGPLGVYGRTKLEGELLARRELPGLTVVRTAWLYGAGGQNFLTRILRAARGRTELNVVEDEFGSPTWSVELSRLLAGIALCEAPGPLYHAAGGGSCSRYGLTAALFGRLGIDAVKLKRVKATAFPSRVSRPANSALASECLERDGFAPLRPWEQALDDFVRLERQRLLNVYRGVDDK